MLCMGEEEGQITTLGTNDTVPDIYGRVSFGEPRREFSNGSFGSIPHLSTSGAPHHRRSESWTHSQLPPSPHGVRHQRSGSWNAGGGVREHSFSMNPLRYTSINRPAPTGDFDQVGRSGSWTGYNSFQPAGLQPGAPYVTPPPPPPGPTADSLVRAVVRWGPLGRLEPNNAVLFSRFILSHRMPTHLVRLTMLQRLL